MFLFVKPSYLVVVFLGVGLVACAALTLAPLSRRKKVEIAVQATRPDDLAESAATASTPSTTPPTPSTPATPTRPARPWCPSSPHRKKPDTDERPLDLPQDPDVHRPPGPRHRRRRGRPRLPRRRHRRPVERPRRRRPRRPLRGHHRREHCSSPSASGWRRSRHRDGRRGCSSSSSSSCCSFSFATNRSSTTSCSSSPWSCRSSARWRSTRWSSCGAVSRTSATPCCPPLRSTEAPVRRRGTIRPYPSGPRGRRHCVQAVKCVLPIRRDAHSLDRVIAVPRPRFSAFTDDNPTNRRDTSGCSPRHRR